MANVNPIPDYSVQVDQNGVLAELVRQPIDNSPMEDENGIHYSEKFKGPYDKIKEVLSYIHVGQTITEAHAVLSAYIGISEQIGIPERPMTRDDELVVFFLKKIRTEESTAGAHGFLYLDYLSQIGGSGGGGGQGKADPTKDVWSVTWQSYSVDPFAFCSNTPNTPYPVSPTFETQPEQATPPPDYSSAMRTHIDLYMKSALPKTKTVSGNTYYYYAPDQTEPELQYFLNDAEAAVLQKKLLGRNATYHYPILTHQTVTKGTINYKKFSDPIGSDIDYETALSGQGCPYEFDSTWHFIKIGDEVSQEKTRASTTFTRKEIFMGVTNFDKNFYGNGQFKHDAEGVLLGRWPIEGV